MFLGKTLESDEYLVGTRQGVHTTRTVRRMREDLRKSRDAVENMKGVPWNMLTTIGRPRKAIIADGVDRAAPGVPKASSISRCSRRAQARDGQRREEAERRSSASPRGKEGESRGDSSP